ncbi:MAG: hypothetical protein PVF93_10810 [Chromatiaceae bacterium]|jgi:hypothetical protein
MQQLIDAVQRNCDIADARHGSDYGMCTYLLKMRELYRWAQGLPLGAKLSHNAVGDWLTEREHHLEQLEHEEFADITVAGQAFEPFDAEAINDALLQEGLVYSAGLVNGARPSFFLAELEKETRADNGFRLRVSGRELARCLNAPPAMTRAGSIFLRRESLRRYLWEKYESWLWNRPSNAMARALAHYPFETALDDALEQMTTAEMATIEAHERGEHQAGMDLGDAWEAMLLDVTMTPAELVARAVRDHLADCTHTLPELASRGREASLHFFVANLGEMRKQLFPSLTTAYEAWLQEGDAAVFAELADRGVSHWRDLAMQLLGLHERHGSDAATAIAEAGRGAAL